MSEPIGPRELEWLEIERIMAGAVGRNACHCNNCDRRWFFDNGAIYQNNLFEFQACRECRPDLFNPPDPWDCPETSGG